MHIVYTALGGGGGGGGGPHVAHNTATAFTSVHQVSSSIRGALSM